MHCVFHGIRFKVKKIGCRDDNQFFFAQFLIGKKICNYNFVGTKTVITN